MLHIRFAPPRDLDVSGRPADLLATRDALSALADGSRTSVTAPAEATIDPAPYAVALGALRARVTEGPIRVAVVARDLVVEGSPAAFDAFASFFEVAPDASPHDHHHHEYFEGNELVHPDSVPLVVRVREP